MKKTLKKVLCLALAAVMTLSLAACTGPTEPQDNATYTYNTALTVFPTNWNPHTYQTATDNEILGYISEGFYTFDYNETKDGYKVVPQMATGDPVDVTSQYVGKYGIEEGDSALAWEIPLRSDLCWQDGTAIKAQDFVTSAQLLLNPKAQNYRADSLYSGNMTIVNAKNYLYQGQYAYETFMISPAYGDDEYIPMDKIVKDADGYYFTPDGKGIAVKLSSAGSWGSTAIQRYGEAGYFKVGDVDYYEVLKNGADANGVVKVNDEVVNALRMFIVNGNGYESIEDYEAKKGDYAKVEWQEMSYLGEEFPAMDFSEVGMFATADDKLVIVLEKPLEGFYLLYSLTSSWLVHEELYKSCETETDGVYNNTYGTTVDKTMSYGPYKLVDFQADKQYVFERNDLHYDVKAGYYQTTKWVVDLVAEASTRLEYFLKGDLDSYGLSVDDMEDYQSSDYTYYTEGDSTFFIALNPNFSALKSAQEAVGADVNKTILTVLEFRQALSYALDRNAFALAADPTASPAFGVFSSQIISDPENGVAYRTTEEAKMVIAEFWGVANEIGEGKLYATLDDAIESITGYNLTKAKQLFDVAYDKAIAEGLMDDNDVIEIKIGTPNATSQAYAKGYEFLSGCYTEAVKGTKLEGKLRFTIDNTLGNGFADALRANQVDMLFFVGWTGSALDPYGLMEAYTTADYQYDPAWDTSTAMWDITLKDGKTYTASVLDWTYTMAGEEITITDKDGNTKQFKCGPADNNPEDRFAILAGLEGAILSTYDMIPLTGDASAALKGMQIKYGTENYVFGVGRGGLKYMTYNYSDAEWEAFVADKGGKLEYK